MALQLHHRKSISILLMLVTVCQVGCRGWIQKPIVADTGVAIPQRGTLRVTKSDRAVISLKDSFITDDSIVGFLSSDPLRRASVARADVTKIEVRGNTTPQGVRTAGKVYLGVVIVLGLVLAVTVIQWLNASSNIPR